MSLAQFAFAALAAQVGFPLVGRAQSASRVPAPSIRGAIEAPTSASRYSVDSLVAEALVVNPAVRAARARVEAARARVAPAGARPDPMLMVGVVNLPLAQPSFSADEMTMRMVGLGQTIPYPGKLALRRRVVERELDAVRAALEGEQLDVARRVRDAYYELAYLDRALDIVEQNRLLLTDFLKVTEARYSVGTGGQEDVFKARVEAARLGDQASTLLEQRRVALAELNAMLDRASETPLDQPTIPERIARGAVADSASHIRFTAQTLGARAADSPLPALEMLQAMAVQESPMLREHESMIAAQAARVELARKEYRPDFDVSLQYGQRDGRSDMVTALISIPLRLQKARKQDQELAEARAELAAEQAVHHAQVNALRARVAKLHSDLERHRTQLALYVKAIIPQGRAALVSATAGYQVGRADVLSLLDSQATLFTYETAYYRALADFAKSLAELEQVVGKEVLR